MPDRKVSSQAFDRIDVSLQLSDVERLHGTLTSVPLHAIELVGFLSGDGFNSARMAELMAQFKAKIDPADTWRATVQSLDAALKPFYLQGRHIGCG